LRIAPDQGFIRVPLLTGPAKNSRNTTRAHHLKQIKVDKWFTEIQENKSSRLLGRNLKAYARVFKSLAQKIAAGHSSTISSTIQSNFFASPTASTANNNQQQKFTSTVTPTISTINLDRTIYEELKLAKHEQVSSVFN
jgi:hypothetical protein